MLKAKRPLRFHIPKGRVWVGGVEEDRTPDLRIANAALSQLSYHPMEVRILALFGPGDNAPVAAGAGTAI